MVAASGATRVKQPMCQGQGCGLRQLASTLDNSSGKPGNRECPGPDVKAHSPVVCWNHFETKVNG